jgi:hypothetical protein
MSDSSIPAFSQPAPPPPAAPVGKRPEDNPGRTLGIVGLVLAIFLNIVGAIVGIVALVKSRKAGYGNGPAIAAIIVGFLFFIGIVIFLVIAVVVGGAAVNQLLEVCSGIPSGGTVEFQGTQVQCP